MVSALNPRRLTVVLGLHQLISWATTFYLPAVIGEVAARDLAASPTAILGGFSWALLVTGGCAPRVGRWIGRHGGRLPLAAGTVVIAGGLVVLAAAPNLACWYAGWTVLGVGMALNLYDAAFAAAGVLLGTEVTPVLTGITLFAGFASTVGWPTGAALIELVGWRGMLLAYAAVQIVVNLPMVLVGVPRGMAEPGETKAAPASGGGRARTFMIACLAVYFATRWFLTSAIAAHVLPLLGGLGLSAGEAVAVSMLIGPGQVAGRLLEFLFAGRLGPLARARVGALLFPAGTLLLLAGGPVAAGAFALMYGMSNGILTVNRGSLPMLVLGPAGYAGILGWLAVPVLLAQAAAPTLSVPLVTSEPSLLLLMLAGGVALVASGLLVPLKVREGKAKGLCPLDPRQEPAAPGPASLK